jgi:hypothetical protein
MINSALASSKAGASRNSTLIAPVGQTGRQKPAPSHKDSSITFALPSIITMAPSAHGVTQMPQPLHNSSSILTIWRTAIIPPNKSFSGNIPQISQVDTELNGVLSAI